jgi:hypothetical protein
MFLGHSFNLFHFYYQLHAAILTKYFVNLKFRSISLMINAIAQGMASLPMPFLISLLYARRNFKSRKA